MQSTHARAGIECSGPARSAPTRYRSTGPHPLVQELVDSGGFELQLRDESDHCRYRLFSGFDAVEERRLHQRHLARTTLDYLLEGCDERMMSAGAFSITGDHGRVDVSYLQDVHGCHLSLRLPSARRWPETLEHTALCNTAAGYLREQLRMAHTGATVINVKDSNESAGIYTASLFEANAHYSHCMSIESIHNRSVPRITHVDAATLQENTAGVHLVESCDALFFSACTNNTIDLGRSPLWQSEKRIFSYHNASSLGTVFGRLLSKDSDHYLLNARLSHLINIASVRAVCPHCADTCRPSRADIEWINQHNAELLDDVSIVWLQSSGCSRCNHSGLAEKISLLEAAAFNRDIEKAIAGGSIFDRNDAVARSLTTESIEKQTRAILRQGKLTLQQYRSLFE